MVRLVHVTVPHGRVNEVVNCLRDMPFVHGLSVNRGLDLTLVTLRCKDKLVRNVIKNLANMGCGTQWGIIDVLAMQMTKPRLAVAYRDPTESERKRKRKKYAVTDRQTIEEIYEIVDSGMHLTFDYMALTVVAAMISGVGLLTNSSVTVVASMLVSPLMGPIVGITFGYLTNDTVMVLKSMRNEIIGVALTFLVGVLMAICTLMSNKNFGITFEMSSRGEYLALLAGVFIASPSGVGVALSVANTNINSLVGVAISAALLPPIVNSGLCIVYGLHRKNQGLAEENLFLRTSGISMCLFLINWILIFVFALAAFHVKGLDKAELEQEVKDNWDRTPFTSRRNVFSKQIGVDKQSESGTSNPVSATSSAMISGDPAFASPSDTKSTVSGATGQNGVQFSIGTSV